MKYIVRDLKSNLSQVELEKELNKIFNDGYKIISCEYVKHEFADINKMQTYKTYIRVIGELQPGKKLLKE